MGGGSLGAYRVVVILYHTVLSTRQCALKTGRGSWAKVLLCSTCTSSNVNATNLLLLDEVRKSLREVVVAPENRKLSTSFSS